MTPMRRTRSKAMRCALLAAVYSCGTEALPEKSVYSFRQTMKTSVEVVGYPFDARILLKGAYPTAVWTPTVDVVGRFETGLQAAMEQSESRRARLLASRISEYTRQYMGTFEEGHYILQAALTCHDVNTFEEKDRFGIADGGECFIDVSFDPARNVYEVLFVHSGG